MPAPDYIVEITAIREAIASGATRVSYEGKSVDYDSVEKLWARLAWLLRLQTGESGKNVSFVTFDRD